MSEQVAKDIMSGNVITIGRNASIEELSGLLIEKKISGVPVIDEQGIMVGIATEGDIIIRDTELHFPRYFKLLDGIIYLESLSKFKNNLKKHLAIKVEEIMTKKVISARENTPVSKIAELMVSHKVNRIPIVDDNNKPIGIVTRADIVKSFAKTD